MVLGMGAGLSQGDFVLDGDPGTLPSPFFGLSPGDFVLDGDPAP